MCWQRLIVALAFAGATHVLYAMVMVSIRLHEADFSHSAAPPAAAAPRACNETVALFCVYDYCRPRRSVL
jgi:hypothetical protein